MRKDWVLTQEAFDAFLRWLSPDRDGAAVEYEKIRRKLLNYFDFRGCDNAEMLADETINRVTERVSRAESGGVNFSTQFVYGVAKNIYRESFSAAKFSNLDEESAAANVSIPEPQVFDDDSQSCMQFCLKQLKETDLRLVIAYFQVNKQTKLREREALCKKSGETINSLRVRVSRIRQKLQKCQRNCLHEKI